MKSLKEIIDFLAAKKLKLTEDKLKTISYDHFEFHTNIQYDFESNQVRNLIVTGLKSCLSG